MSSDGRRGRGRGWKFLALLAIVGVGVWLGWRYLGSSPEIPASEVRHDDDTSKTLISQGPKPGEVPLENKSSTSTTPSLSNAVIGEEKPAANPAPAETKNSAEPATTTQPEVNAPDDTAAVNSALQAALAQIDSDPVRARDALTRLLEGSAISPADRLKGYEGINKVNAVLTFSERVLANDPYAQQYTVKEGDSLSNIRKALNLDCEWRFLQRINHLATERSIRVGQVLKAPKDAFHGEVRKAEFRLNIFEGDGPKRVMVASYPISLGEFNSTPTGAFAIRPRSKLIDPEWRNPRTGEHFQSNDPKNPIGERWIGLKGIEPHNKAFEGYGIHGTIDPGSIGQQASMGCIRMYPQDVEVVYELLTEPNSIVTIAP
ncbi:MAG: L,D-transpeptidase family protein [Planctomycetes bacterium]|nr:L,D-transpeptidase family protein [Planctomycetota bacterium]